MAAGNVPEYAPAASTARLRMELVLSPPGESLPNSMALGAVAVESPGITSMAVMMLVISPRLSPDIASLILRKTQFITFQTK